LSKKYAGQSVDSVGCWKLWKILLRTGCGRAADGLRTERQGVLLAIQHVPGQQQDEVVTVSITADYTRLLAVTLPAFHLMSDVLKRFDELSKSPT
jgi:hypothetical protein